MPQIPSFCALQALVEGSMDVVRPTLLRGPNFSRVVVQVHDIHCAAATSSSPATAPALEVLRAFIDTGGFFLPSIAQTCSAPDAEMLLYSVSTLMPPCNTFLRLRNKVLCVPLPEVPSEPADDGVFSPLTSSHLVAVCTDFMQSLRDSILVDHQPSTSTAHVCDFLTTAVREINSVCKLDAPQLLFDVSAMLHILRRVHADLATVPFDFIRNAAVSEKLKENMSGSMMMDLFGNLLYHAREEEDLLERQKEALHQLGAEQVRSGFYSTTCHSLHRGMAPPLVSTVFYTYITPLSHCGEGHIRSASRVLKPIASTSRMQDPSVDEIRLEHVWLLLAGELLREASRAANGPKLQQLVQTIGAMLGDKLLGLCQFYEEKAEQDAVDAMAASLIAMNASSKSPGTATDAMNLWQADEVRVYAVLRFVFYSCCGCL
jgi:hypothetical protein